MDGQKKKSTYIFASLRIAVVLVGVGLGIIWVSREQRWEHLLRIFREMNPVIFCAALCIFAISQVIIGLRWWLLLRTQQIYIGLWAAVKLHYLGLFYNNFMPSSVGGDLVRAWYVTMHTDKRFAAALSVFVDRVIGLLSTLIIACFFYILFLRGQGVTSQMSTEKEVELLSSAAEHRMIFIYVFLVIAGVLGVMLFFKRGRVFIQKVWSVIFTHVNKILKKTKDAAVLYCKKPLTILTAITLTFFLQIMVITGFWFLGKDIGITASIKYYYVFFTLTWVLGAIPVSIGGAIVVEGSLAYLFTTIAGVPPEAAAALALCQRAVWMLCSLPGAAIHAFGVHMPKDFSVDYTK